jgi:hypothetical protein
MGLTVLSLTLKKAVEVSCRLFVLSKMEAGTAYNSRTSGILLLQNGMALSDKRRTREVRVQLLAIAHWRSKAVGHQFLDVISG